MKGKVAGAILLGVCVLLAVLLVASVVTPPVSGAIFAAALAVLGLASRGFRRS